ncbi:MAG TPA: AAA family ATPase [Nitrospira sp.]|nr:AAA family ATPase [Nitrospira sp.]
MYQSFYNLRIKPFRLLPDSGFLYAGSTHRAAYSTLEYGLINEAAFMVLTGEPGMGKTSLLRKLIAEHGAKQSIGLVTNARYNIEHLLPWVLLSLGLSRKQLDPVEAYYVFSEFLSQESRQHRRVILIIDEAQSLGTDLLEELRLLSNLNDDSTLKLQIILSGQPDLHKLLQRIDMTQFAQRVVVDCHLEPLSEVETARFIRHRLHVAGGHASLFTNKACALVHRLTRGNPRLINQVCDLALTHGAALQAPTMTAKLVAQAALERSKGKILPLSSRDELTVLTSIPDDPGEIDAAPSEPGPPQWAAERPSPERTTAQSASPEPFIYAKGVALRKEGRLNEAIEILELAGKNAAYRLKAHVQIGLCHRAAGDHQAAIQMFRAVLNDPSASPTEARDIQYFLARTLESADQTEEAVALFRRIVQTHPRFKDAAYRANQLSSQLNAPPNSEGRSTGRESWFSTALKNFQRWPLLASK